MNASEAKPIEVLIVAVPETAGSALYGMVDVLSSAGNIWQPCSEEHDCLDPLKHALQPLNTSRATKSSGSRRHLYYRAMNVLDR